MATVETRRMPMLARANGCAAVPGPKTVAARETDTMDSALSTRAV